eukprot:Rmarinus@m.27645
MVVTGPGRRAPSVPPEKGAFPLDHLGECTHLFKKYMECLKENDRVGTRCRVEAKEYLQCRMQKGLMAEEEWGHLGFAKEESNEGRVFPHVDTSTLDPSVFQVRFPTEKREDILRKRKEAMESPGYRPTAEFAYSYKGINTTNQEGARAKEEQHNAQNTQNTQGVKQ